MATLQSDKSNQDLQMRLRRVEGQIRGIIGMLDNGKTCEQVVTQILAARAAMDSVAMELLRCQVDEAMRDASPADARETVLRALNLLNRV
ncbi:MAG TPA: metal-sensitive transcriptional regulator [Ktedonobacterales bacterium]